MQWSLVSPTKFAFAINAVKSHYIAKENAEKISGPELTSLVTRVSAYSRSHVFIARELTKKLQCGLRLFRFQVPYMKSMKICFQE